MVETKKLDEIIGKCGIIKEICTLPESILGYYYSDGNYYIILINKSITNNENLYRSVLAEEIGHYRTTIGDITPRKHMCYRDRLTIDKEEQKALRWATDFLIPSNMLINTIKDKVANNLYDLSDFFQITREFLLQKLYFMSLKQPIWSIDERRSLHLYNYPNIVMFDNLKIL